MGAENMSYFKRKNKAINKENVGG
jgi:hypothetical protein